jgi:hypothetical protein
MINRALRRANQWLISTPERALEQAYDAALMIKSIEDEHFAGGKISKLGDRHSLTVLNYFDTELKKYLKIAELRLTEFRASRFVVDTTNSTLYSRSSNGSTREQSSVMLEKLQYIDAIIERYQERKIDSKSLVSVNSTEIDRNNSLSRSAPTGSSFTAEQLRAAGSTSSEDYSQVLDKTGVLPRSIAGTLSRIKRDLDPKAEQEFVQDYRANRAKTLVSVRFLLLLIIVPLLVQQLSKNFLVGPIVDRFRSTDESEIFINYELEEQALRELQIFEERLRFENLLERVPKLSEVKIEAQLKEKAQELAIDYSHRSSNAIKNIFADMISLIAFAIVIVTNQREIQILKSFIDDTVYGLSDSAKAFIIILFTDIFVGFHSPHGWEVILEGISKHLGLAPNRDFIFLFIATFPVILDTIFKYWIFRYLNRISPSAVATYKNMNET